MASSAHTAAPSSAPAKDTVLRQLLRPLAPHLARTDVTELAVNRPGEVWLRTSGRWERVVVPELTAEHLDALATVMAVHSGLSVQSIASVVLPCGERGQLVRAPACVDGQTPITIRKHLAAVKTLRELEGEGAFAEVRDVSFHRPTAEDARREAARTDAGRLDSADVELLAFKRERCWADFLSQAVLARRNIVVAGKTGSGKTTLARSLIDEVPAQERIVTIEDVHELALPTHPNRVHLLYGHGPGRVSAEACLAACMRLSPDRIFLAELRGGEAWEYVQGLNTGHPGSVTTTHANGAVHAFERIASLVKSSDTGHGLERAEIRRELYATLDVVIFMADRKVTELYFDPIHARSDAHIHAE